MNQMKSSLDLLKLLTPVVLAILIGEILWREIIKTRRLKWMNETPTLESPC